MKEKIKNLFEFIGSAWAGGIRGRLGLAFFLFAIFVFLRMFWGNVNIQTFIANTWNLRNEQMQLDAKRAILSELEHHNALLQQNSPDYVEEVGLQTLNIGDSKTKILKF